MGDFYLGSALICILFYVFVGVNVLVEHLLDSITVITSAWKYVEVHEEGPGGKVIRVADPTWSPAMAHVTLLALGSAAPEIFLCVFSTFANIDGVASSIGPISLIGSASFNLLVVSAISIICVSEVKKVKRYCQFLATIFFSTLVYLWLFVILSVSSPGQIQLWEAVCTLLLYACLCLTIFLIDR